MHEASLMRGLVAQLEAIARDQAATRVVGVTVRLGALSHFSPAHFREHFVEAAAGTCAAGATIEAIVDTDIRTPGAADVLLESVELE